jgi:hypothetical protein
MAPTGKKEELREGEPQILLATHSFFFPKPALVWFLTLTNIVNNYK